MVWYIQTDTNLAKLVSKTYPLLLKKYLLLIKNKRLHISSCHTESMEVSSDISLI